MKPDELYIDILKERSTNNQIKLLKMSVYIISLFVTKLNLFNLVSS